MYSISCILFFVLLERTKVFFSIIHFYKLNKTILHIYKKSKIYHELEKFILLWIFLIKLHNKITSIRNFIKKKKEKSDLKKGSCIPDARLRKSSREISLFPRSKSRHFLPSLVSTPFPAHIAAAKIGSLCRQREEGAFSPLLVSSPRVAFSRDARPQSGDGPLRSGAVN